MKKMIIVAIAILVCASVAMAQNPQYASPVGGVTGGIQGIDKLGAHQNGGRGCVGCHAPHSGGRGNGGVMHWDNIQLKYVPTTVTGDSGNETLWGQDIGPVVSMGPISFGSNIVGGYVVDPASTSERIKTGVVYCLSCHDGNVAKGAMMTGSSFEQAAGLLPATYGGSPIPTLLGADGGANGNYANDHPIGPLANVGALPIGKYLAFDSASAPTKLVLAGTQPDAFYTNFQANYGLPLITGARTGAGLVVETGMASVSAAYVVCTTCHTPHSMYTASASASNPIAGLTKGVFPSYFFLAAPYNPGANVANGTKASSATQFCRQCHFSGAGGSNEASGISIPTAF